jgi:hypothetical protein
MAAVRAAAAPHGRSPRFAVTLRPAEAGAGQMAQVLLDYVAIGVSTLLIRGYDSEADAAGYAEIIARVRDRAGRARVA